jgi:CheY-like chemotaxis protein
MMHNWNVLVIEDEADSAEVVARILKFHNIACRVAGTAEEALTLMREQKPTLLIVDLALPGMDGWEFLKTVRSDPDTAQIHAVAVTAFHSTSVAQKAIEAGFNAYFPKPLEPTSFVRELERILNG